MIVASLLLILVAVTLLVLGLAGGSSTLLISSIGASLLAAVALVIGARHSAAQRRAGAPDGPAVPADGLSGTVRAGTAASAPFPDVDAGLRSEAGVTGETVGAGTRAGRSSGRRAGSDGPGYAAGPDGPGYAAGPDGPGYAAGPDGPGYATGPDGPGFAAGPGYASDASGYAEPGDPGYVDPDDPHYAERDAPAYAADAPGRADLGAPAYAADAPGRAEPDAPAYAADAPGRAEPDAPAYAADAPGQADPDVPAYARRVDGADLGQASALADQVGASPQPDFSGSDHESADHDDVRADRASERPAAVSDSSLPDDDRADTGQSGAPDYDRASSVIGAARSETPPGDAWRRDEPFGAGGAAEGLSGRPGEGGGLADPGGFGEPAEAGGFDEADEDDPADEPLPQAVRPNDAVRVAQMDADVLVVDGRPRYHMADCEHLAGRLTEPLPVREAVELGFSPCGLCRPVDRLVAQAARR